MGWQRIGNTLKALMIPQMGRERVGNTLRAFTMSPMDRQSVGNPFIIPAGNCFGRGGSAVDVVPFVVVFVLESAKVISIVGRRSSVLGPRSSVVGRRSSVVDRW